jgi:hypothetical protein
MGGLVGRLLGVSLVGVGLWWLWAWLHPAPEKIQIIDPDPNATLLSPVTVRGVGEAIFENQLGVRVRDEGGAIIGSGSVVVTAPVGGRGPFSGTVSYTLGGGSQAGRIEVFDSSPRDGGTIHLSSVEVTLA